MSNVKYTKDHEWVQTDDNASATVGITVHAQDALGDVVFVDLPEVGKQFAQGEVAGVVESVKAAADVYMPVTGEGARNVSAYDETGNVATASFHHALERASHHATGVPTMSRMMVVIAASSIVRRTGCQISGGKPSMPLSSVHLRRSRISR